MSSCYSYGYYGSQVYFTGSVIPYQSKGMSGTHVGHMVSRFVDSYDKYSVSLMFAVSTELIAAVTENNFRMCLSTTHRLC